MGLPVHAANATCFAVEAAARPLILVGSYFWGISMEITELNGPKFRQAVERFINGEPLIYFLILTGAAWLALTFIPYFGRFNASLGLLLTSAVSGLIVGWCANKPVFFIVKQIHGKEGVGTEAT